MTQHIDDLSKDRSGWTATCILAVNPWGKVMQWFENPGQTGGEWRSLPAMQAAEREHDLILKGTSDRTAFLERT